MVIANARKPTLNIFEIWHRRDSGTQSHVPTFIVIGYFARLHRLFFAADQGRHAHDERGPPGLLPAFVRDVHDPLEVVTSRGNML